MRESFPFPFTVLTEAPVCLGGFCITENTVSSVIVQNGLQGEADGIQETVQIKEEPFISLQDEHLVEVLIVCVTAGLDT